MTAPIDMSVFAARVSRPPFWPATAGEQPKPTGDNPIPSRPGPQETRDAEIVGRLGALLRQIAADADHYQVPADMRQLIGQAQRICAGDLPEWQTDTRRAAA